MGMDMEILTETVMEVLMDLHTGHQVEILMDIIHLMVQMIMDIITVIIALMVPGLITHTVGTAME
jgi:hypothetical protein